MTGTKNTKQKLIDTARDLIWSNSYGSVSVDDICKTSDVKKGSFYHYFPSKVDLAVAAMDECAQNMKASYDAAFSPSLEPLARFEALADAVYDGQVEAQKKYGRVCGCPSASLSSEIAGQEDAVRAKFSDNCARQQRYYESALRDLIEDGSLPKDTDIKAKAQEISTYIIGQLTVARIQNSLDALKRDLKPGIIRLLGLQEKKKGAA